MTMQNGSLTNADEVLNVTGKTFANQAQLIYGLNISENDLTNTVYSEHLTDDMDAVNMAYDTVTDKYIGPVLDSDGDYDAIDEFNDSSVDTTIWTENDTGASGIIVSEDTSDLLIRQSTGANSDSAGNFVLEGSGSVNLPTDYNTAVRIETTSITSLPNWSLGGGVAFQRIVVTDGSNNLTVYSHTALSDDTDPHTVTFLVILNREGQSILHYKVDSEAWSTANISVWSLADLTFKFEVATDNSNSGNAKTVDWKVNWTRFVDMDGNSPDASVTQTTAKTTNATVTNAIMTANVEGDTNLQYNLSADNGSNFEDVSEATIHRFTNTGTQLKTKITWSGYTSEFALDKDAVMYNLY